MTDLLTKLSAEAHRIEEDTEHSAKGHFNAAERWGRFHLAIGLPAAVLAAIAGGSVFSDLPKLACHLTKRGVDRNFPLKISTRWPIMSLTYPPRLAGFDREAQPWRVFYARMMEHRHAV